MKKNEKRKVIPDGKEEEENEQLPSMSCTRSLIRE